MGRIRARGITLMELVVALVLASVVALASVKVDQLGRSQAFRVAERATQHHRARVALQHLRERIGLGAKDGRADPNTPLAKKWGTSVQILSFASDDLQLCEFQSTDPNAVNDATQYRKIRYQFDAATKELRFSVSTTDCNTSGGWPPTPQVLLAGVESMQFSRLRQDMIRFDMTLNSPEQAFFNTDIFLRGASGLSTDASLQDGW